MSNIATIAGDTILGKTRKLSDAEVSILAQRFELLYNAFETMQLTGEEVIHNGDVITNNDEIVYL